MESTRITQTWKRIIHDYCEGSSDQYTHAIWKGDDDVTGSGAEVW